jgi:hypothetical protein
MGGEDQRRVRLQPVAEAADEGGLGQVVHRAGRLVEEDHARLAEQRAGDGDSLALAAGDGAAALADRQRVTERMALRQRGDAGSVRRLLEPLLLVAPAEQDVFPE